VNVWQGGEEEPISNNPSFSSGKQTFVPLGSFPGFGNSQELNLKIEVFIFFPLPLPLITYLLF